MVEKRKNHYKKAACILTIIFFISVAGAQNITASIGSVSANTLYFIQSVYVLRSDATDVRFCSDANCTSVVTPSYFFVANMTPIGSAYRANIYVSFASSYSQLYMKSHSSTSFQTTSSTPPYTTTPGQQIYAPNGAIATMTYVSSLSGGGYTTGDNAILYLNNTNNQGYNIKTQTAGLTTATVYTGGTNRGTVSCPATVTIEWGNNYLTYYWPGGSATITPGVTRTTNLVPKYVLVQGFYAGVTSFRAWALNTTKTYTIIDSTAPAILNVSITWQNTSLLLTVNATDNSVLSRYEIRVAGDIVASGDIYNTLWNGFISIPYSTIASLPNTITINIYDIANNTAQSNVTLPLDTIAPGASASISTTATAIVINFTASDDRFLKNYAVLLNDEQLTAENVYAQTFSKNLTYPAKVLIGKTNPEFRVVVYDAGGNSNHTILVVPKMSLNLVILDENRNAQLNFTNFQEVYVRLVSENNTIYIVRNGQYVSGSLINNTTLQILANLNETIRITWLYKNYPDYYSIELMPVVASVWGSNTVIGISGLLNNTTIPYLYEFLALSSEKRPVIIERVNPKVVKLATMTQYPYDRYLIASAFLQREIYNLYTVDGGVLVFLSAIDGGRAQAVNIDALIAQKKPVTMIYGSTLDCEWLDNKTLRVAFKTADPLTKLTTINVYVNNTLITTISQIANEMQGLVAFDQFNVTITNQTRIKIEAIRENVKIVREFLGYEETKFKLPVPLAIGLGVCLLLFGLTLIGIESTIRYFGFVMLFMVVAVVSLSDLNDTILRIVLVVALILIVVFIAANLRGERE